MSDYYYVGSGTPDNWSDDVWASSSGGSPLSSEYPDDNGDKAIFDANGSGDVLLDASVTIGELSQSGYTGTLDLDDKTLTVDDSGGGTGDVTLDGTIDFGTGVLDVDGNVTATAIDAVPGGTGKLLMRGASKTYAWSTHGARDVPNLEIASGASVTCNTANEVAKLLEVKGTLTVNGTLKDWDDLKVGSGATINGSGSLESGPAKVISQQDGTVSAAIIVKPPPSVDAVPTGAVFDGDLTVYGYLNGAVMQMPSAFTVKGTFSAYSRDVGETVTLDFDTNDTSATFEGDVDFGGGGDGTLSHRPGSGTITLSGTGAQDIDFNGESVEAITIDSDDTVTLSGAVETVALTLTDGTLDIDGQDLDIDGNLTMAAGTELHDTDTGGTVSIGGNLDINGEDGTECVWSDADIDVLTGTGDADWCTVSDSNNSSGTSIDATDDCTDGTGNTGWDFGGAGVTGTAAQTLGAITQSASGGVEVSGSAVQSLPSLNQAASGGVEVSGSVEQTLPAVSQSASGAVTVSGSAAQQLPSVSQAAAGEVEVSGAAAQSLPSLSQSAAGKVEVSGFAAQTLPTLTQSASGSVPVSGTVAQTLPDATQSASGTIATGSRTGTASQTLAALVQAAVGGVQITGTAAQTLPSISQSATNIVPIPIVWHLPSRGTAWTLPPENRGTTWNLPARGTQWTFEDSCRA